MLSVKYIKLFLKGRIEQEIIIKLCIKIPNLIFALSDVKHF